MQTQQAGIDFGDLQHPISITSEICGIPVAVTTRETLAGVEIDVFLGRDYADEYTDPVLHRVVEELTSDVVGQVLMDAASILIQDRTEILDVTTNIQVKEAG